MDFVHDSLAGGGSIRVLTVLDVFTRECVALEAGVGFRGEDVARILMRAREGRGALPELISVDNGTEFTSRALDHWAYWNQVKLDFSRPGKPTDNAHIEAFNASLMRECLSQHWFLTLADIVYLARRGSRTRSSDGSGSGSGPHTLTSISCCRVGSGVPGQGPCNPSPGLLRHFWAIQARFLATWHDLPAPAPPWP